MLRLELSIKKSTTIVSTIRLIFCAWQLTWLPLCVINEITAFRFSAIGFILLLIAKKNFNVVSHWAWKFLFQFFRHNTVCKSESFSFGPFASGFWYLVFQIDLSFIFIWPWNPFRTLYKQIYVSLLLCSFWPVIITFWPLFRATYDGTFISLNPILNSSTFRV